MEKAKQFALELQKLLEKHNVTIRTELDDRAIIFYFEGDKQVYLFHDIYVSKENASEIEAW